MKIDENSKFNNSNNIYFSNKEYILLCTNDKRVFLFNFKWNIIKSIRLSLVIMYHQTPNLP